MLITLIFCICLYGQQSKSYINIAPMNITTPYSVTCDHFEKDFCESAKKKYLNYVQTKGFILLFDKLKRVNLIPYMDVRYKGQIFHKNKSYSFCGDEAIIMINGEYYYVSKSLINKIKNLYN